MAPAVYGASAIQAQFPLPVYGKPDFESPILFTVEAGTTVLVSDRTYGAFRKIKAKLLGQSRTGFVPATDLKARKAPPRERIWGLGGGFTYSRLSQGSKSFSTVDQVNYKISGYSGQSVSPLLSVQGGFKNFWRAFCMYRRVNLSGDASSDIGGTSAQHVELEYTMLALGGQFAWGLWSDLWYAGLGAEFAKTTASKVMFGAQDLTKDADPPDYISVFGVTGLQLKAGDKFSMFGELRVGAVTNQSPSITVVEVSAQLLYWP